MFEALKKKQAGLSKQVKASTAYTICNILQNSVGIITLPLFTRLMTTDEMGISTIYSSTMPLLIIFTSLQLAYGTFDTAMAKFDKDRDGYVSSVNGLCTLLTAVYFIIYLIGHKFWNSLLDLPTILMLVMGLEMLMTTSMNFWLGKNRFEYEYKKVVAVILSQTFIATALGILATVYGGNYRGVLKVLAYSFIAIGFGLVMYIHGIVKGKKFYNKEYWHYALSFNLPLVPYYVSQMIFNQSDRLMINKMCGRGDAAIYGVAYTLAVILTIILNAINGSYTPWLYGKIKDRDFQDNKRVALAIGAVMAFLLLGMISVAPEIILIMAGKKYTSAMWVVPPVAMSIIFLFYTQLFSNIQFYFEEKYYLVAGSILSALANVVLNYIFIKKYGFVAAAYTTLFSFIIFAICNFICMRIVCKKHDVDWHIYDYRKLIIMALIFMALGFGLTMLYPYRLARFIVIGVVLVIFAIFFKKIMNIVKFYVGLFK